MKRTGVIIGFDQPIPADEATQWGDLLGERFPGVKFAIVCPTSTSIAFEFDDTETQP